MRTIGNPPCVKDFVTFCLTGKIGRKNGRDLQQDTIHPQILPLFSQTAVLGAARTGRKAHSRFSITAQAQRAPGIKTCGLARRF
jgi:hypothetical protein